MAFKWIVAGSAALLLSAGPALAGDQPHTVKIGVLTDMSGTYSDLSGQGSVTAVEMAVEDFGGKVAGMPIEVLSADHQNKADVGSSVARKWFDVDGVDMIIDMTNSAVSLAVREIAREKGKIDISTGAATSGLTGAKCGPLGFHWVYDTAAMARSTASAVVKQGGDSWFFLTADYAFGHDLENQTSAVIKANGGKVLGSVAHPFPSSDMSSFLLQAQASRAKIVGLANAGTDTINSIKQAKEFGIAQGGQKLAALLAFITDIHSLGLETAQGLMVTEGFYWDADEATRAWSKRFGARMNGKMPTMIQAGNYSAVTHYLKAVQAAKSTEGTAVAAKMRELPIKDFFAKNGHLRPDGLMEHDMYLMQVKKPSESKGGWDLYNVLRVVPGSEAFTPLSESPCPLAKS